MIRAGALLVLVFASAACESPPPPEPPAPKAAPKPPEPAWPRAFGAALDSSVPLVPLTELLGDPVPYLGREVRTEGIVRRVCKRAGCWLELSHDARASATLRVPMAGHAFAIPQEAVDRHAEIQGTLAAQPLPEDTQTHLAGEGAHALGPLALTATGVRVERN